MHGQDTTIPKGTEITAYVNRNMKLDFAKFQAAQPSLNAVSAPASGAVPAGDPKTGAELEFSSSPSENRVQTLGTQGRRVQRTGQDRRSARGANELGLFKDSRLGKESSGRRAGLR